MDPGNFATNIQAGSRFGYTLMWVVLTANLIAMLFQVLSAKLGLVTGRNLAEMCRDRFPPWIVWPMWVVSEVAAMATDLAEFLGGRHRAGPAARHAAAGRHGGHRSRDLRDPAAGALRLLERSGFSAMEIVICAIVLVIGLCYVIELFIAPVSWGSA